jgi:phosphatidylglycerophosphatase A
MKAEANEQSFRTVLKIAIGTGFGLGYFPIAPGSWAALLGVAFHVATALYVPDIWQTPLLIGAFLAVSAANHILTPWAETYWQCKDPGKFVLDEIAGYLIVPILFHHGRLWQVALWGFLFFRVFDVIKIPPARQIDRQMEGSWGILLDDVVSACYAVLAMYGLMWAGVQFGAEAWLIQPSTF